MKAGGEILISARRIGLRYGDRRILEGVDLDLRRGEHWLIWGGNGAGKTSLARLLAGLDAPTEGEISFHPSLGLPLPFLFQDPDAQLAAATVRDEIALGARRPGEPRVRHDEPGPAGERVATLLRDYGFEDRRTRNPHSLSGGEKRRLGLAALEALGAEVLILDEPELHLDPGAQAAWLERLDAWRASTGGLVLEISHDPSRALAADGILLLREGRLVAAGPPEEVYRAHRGDELPRVAEWEEQATVSLPGPPPAGDESLLGCEGIGLDLPDGTPLLSNLNLRVARGEKLLLIGGNGCGKSTLLLLLAGLADPDRGKVERAAGLGCGLALQEPERACFAESVREEVSFAPHRRGLRGRDLEARADAALGRMGLEPDDFGPRDPFRLSAGEQRRVALAAVMAAESELLLLDEPAASLDPLGRRALARALVDWPGAVIWADSREPEGLADLFHRRLRLTAGKLEEVDS